MATQREVALEGCDRALRKSITELTQTYSECLFGAKDKAQQEGCKQRYEAGMREAKKVHNVNRKLVDLIFPAPVGGGGEGGSGTTPPSQRDVALAGCDDALKDKIAQLTGSFAHCLRDAGTSKKLQQECEARYEKGMRRAKSIHDVNRELVDKVFPSPKKVGDGK